MVKKVYKPRKNLFSLWVLFAIALLGAAFVYHINSTYAPIVSDESAVKLRELNMQYGFEFGEDLLGTRQSPALVSLLQNDVFNSFGDSEYQGILLQFEGENNEGHLILMTPKHRIKEEKLWKIAETYSDAIPEIEFAEPDIMLEVYSSHSYQVAFSSLVDRLVTLGASYIDEDTISLSSAGNTQYKWWLKKKKNHSLRARLNFPSNSVGAPIAVLDSGAEISHPYYTDRIWDNEDEISANKVDDDHNGYVDDIHGCDFTQVKCMDVDDAIGHGTHMMGIIAKYTRQAGASDIAVLKVFDRESESRLSYMIKAIKYGTDNGMRVINISSGTTIDSRALRESTEYAYSRGAFIVAAAGNNSSLKKHYPAAYSKVISVGALNNEGERLERSNYGNWVNVWAPGERVISTIPGGRYGYLSGTSQASPFVAAQVAGILYKEPNLEITDMIERLTEVDFMDMSGPSPYDA